MKKILALLITLTSLVSAAQDPNYNAHEKPPKGPVQEYKYKLRKMRSSAMVALVESEAYQRLADTLNRVAAASDNYKAFSLFYEGFPCNYDQFNRLLTSDGFTPLRNFRSRIGIGLSTKRDRKIFDLHFIVLGIADKSQSGKRSIKTNFSNFFDLTWGYDVLRSSNYSLYPYAGVGLRYSSIKYGSEIQTDSSYTYVGDILVENRSVNTSTIDLAYLLGIGFDTHIQRSKNDMDGIVAFIKIGVNKTFRKETFNIHGLSYKPDFRQGDLMLSVGLKIYAGIL